MNSPLIVIPNSVRIPCNVWRIKLEILRNPCLMVQIHTEYITVLLETPMMLTKNLLPYGEEIQDHKEVEVNEYFIEALDHYTGAKVVVPGKYSIPVLSRVKYRKRNSLCNPIDEEHSKPILDTSIYEL